MEDLANLLLGSRGLKSLLLAHPTWGLSLQVPEGIPHGAVPTLCATQMHSAPALHLLPLALREPATSPVHPPSGRHLQLQPRRLLHQVRRGYGPLPGGRRVSAPPSHPCPTTGCLQGSLVSPGSDTLRIGQGESEKPAIKLLLGRLLHLGTPSYGLDLGSDPAVLWGRPLPYPLFRNPTQAFLLLSISIEKANLRTSLKGNTRWPCLFEPCRGSNGKHC